MSSTHLAHRWYETWSVMTERDGHECKRMERNRKEWYMNGVLGHDSALVRLYWTRDILGWRDEFCYESWPRCRIVRSIYRPAVQRATLIWLVHEIEKIGLDHVVVVLVIIHGWLIDWLMNFISNNVVYRIHGIYAFFPIAFNKKTHILKLKTHSLVKHFRIH